MPYTTIDDPSAYFHTQLYVGNNPTGQSITNDANAGDFQPDWLWIKSRTTSGGSGVNFVVDSTRGNTKDFHTSNNEAEHTNSNMLGSFDSNGFTIGASASDNINKASDNYVAWQWIANGGTTSSNTDGTITSTVQANTTAGFSIVSYTGNGTVGATVGHGLSTPDVVLIKSRSITGFWIYNSFIIGSTGGTPDAPRNLYLNDTAAGQSDKVCRNISASTFEISSSSAANTSGATYLAYCFKNVQGYQKTGLYTGNGNADGPFFYTGFRPAWVMTKRTDSNVNGDWAIYDNKRSASGGGNENNKNIKANTNDAEASNTGIDILSNGVKIRSTSTRHNANGGTYIYMAFAEHPFVSSEGVPTTAR